MTVHVYCPDFLTLFFKLLSDQIERAVPSGATTVEEYVKAHWVYSEMMLNPSDDRTSHGVQKSAPKQGARDTDTLPAQLLRVALAHDSLGGALSASWPGQVLSLIHIYAADDTPCVDLGGHLIQRQRLGARRHLHQRRDQGDGVEHTGHPGHEQPGQVGRPERQLIATPDHVCVPRA